MNKISEKEMAKQKKDFGHEIKENTELTEHETGINDVKKNAKSAFNKMKEAIQKFQLNYCNIKAGFIE